MECGTSDVNSKYLVLEGIPAYRYAKQADSDPTGLASTSTPVPNTSSISTRNQKPGMKSIEPRHTLHTKSYSEDCYGLVYFTSTFGDRKEN